MFSSVVVWCVVSLVTAVGSVENGLECGNVVCAGNATCLINIDQEEPICIKRTKPGSCQPDDELSGCSELQLYCVSDSDCPAAEICCKQGCARSCQKPAVNITPKPGHCPARSTFGPCVVECSEDGECPSSTKCCSTGCGFVCSSPAVVKPGHCPLPDLVPGNCTVTCRVDTQCPPDLKCCSNGCGTACVSPSDQPICPEGVTFHSRCNKCSCSGKQEPVDCQQEPCPPEKPGVCPGLARQSDIVAAGCGNSCVEDANCPGQAKCCQVEGCGLTCSPTAVAKPGICPVAEGSDPCGEFCHDDSDCPQEAKCCLTGCGRICKAPESGGFCPSRLATPSCVFRDDHCSTGSDCLQGQICCDSPCGKRCSWPAVEKPGLCPSTDQLDFGGGGIFCSDDQDCSRELKCCSDQQGGQNCVQPTVYKKTCRNIKCKKPGFYCIDSQDGPECVDKPKSTCLDTVCDDNTDCLQKPDRATCVPHTKVGHCPLIATPLRPCQSVRVQCELDEDCPDEAICCTAGCRRSCVQPVRTDCQSIGHALCRTAGYVCRDRDQGAVCVEDIYTCDSKTCPGGYQCIESFTGARCSKIIQSCDAKICARGEICYMEEDGAVCLETVFNGGFLAEASIDSEVKLRPGRCPPVWAGRYRGDCKHTCTENRHCPKEQLCCDQGCARVCVDPVFRVSCEELKCLPDHACVDSGQFDKDAICLNTTQKPGRCPAGYNLPPPAIFVNQSTAADCDPICNQCSDECSYDLQCDAGAKCCRGPCGNRCTPPDLRLRCEDIECDPGYFCYDSGLEDATCLSEEPRGGRCPVSDLEESPFTAAVCETKPCLFDESCGPGEKCCSGPCGPRCVAADSRLLCEDIECGEETGCVELPNADAECFSTVEKEGLCPRVLNGTRTRGGCTTTCKYDSQCDGDSKCCYNGCAEVCLAPREPDCETIKCRVGTRCTEDRQGKPICQPIPCKQDGEIIDIECNSCTCIQGFLLCSQKECPPVKPGFCPKLTKGYRGRCVEECDSDYDCEDKNKCCFTGCGHACQEPVPEIVHPCKTVRFRCGDATRCAATRGLCQPGQTCPLSPLCVNKNVPFCKQCPLGKVCVLQKQACHSVGTCHRQPICVQLYSDDTIFEEDADLETEVVIRQNS